MVRRSVDNLKIRCLFCHADGPLKLTLFLGITIILGKTPKLSSSRLTSGGWQKFPLKLAGHLLPSAQIRHDLATEQQR